jgi:regulatory protein
LPDRQEEIRQAAAVHEARTAAIKALGRRARTRRDLERRLLAKGLPEAAITEALDWLADRGYVNDELYAQTRLETLRKRRWGAEAIRQKLAQEGVPGPVAAEALSQQAEELHETELACDLAREREARLGALPWPQRRSRIYQYLARRGFAAEVISAALAQIEPADRSSEGSEEA